MECREGLTDLLGELYSNIDMLQKAIADVGQIKASLKLTASDLKSQIRDSVSRHLEALRNRETWLLGQVEVVQHVKEDALHQQQSEFNKALGRLQSLCVLLEQTGEVLNNESLECHVRESTTALGDLNFSPEETKVINFVAQNFELQELIQKFGAVVSDNPVADKQLVPYFQMFGLEKKSSFFTPSGPSEKWLMKTSGANTSQDTYKIPSFELNIQDWLQPKRVPGTSTTESSVPFPKPHSIEHWLSKGQSKMCTAEKEISLQTPESKGGDNDNAATTVTNKTSEIQGWLLDSSRTRESTIMPTDQFSYYKVVKMSDSSQWLKKSGITEGALPTNHIGKTSNDSVTSAGDEWLMKKVERTGSTKFSRSISTQSCSDCSGGLSSECSDVELDDTLSEMSNQLVVEKEESENSSGIGASSSYLASEVPDNDGWLLKQSCKTNVSAPNHNGIKKYMYKDNLAAQSTQHWLHPRSEQVSDNGDAQHLAASGMKSYIDSLPVGKNHWLLNPSTDKGICKWLAGSSFERCKNCPTMCFKGVFEVFDQIASSKDGWLLSQELY